jgi:molybdopterin molybdotransferase
MPEPSTGEIGVEEARARMLAGVTRVGVEPIALSNAVGRTLAEPVAALRDQPPFDASAMDGYAVREGETAGDFRLVGQSAAGRPFSGVVDEGETVRIFTGAAVPSGCRVIVQERAVRDGERVRFEASVGAATFVRPRGGDFKAGQVLLRAGDRLDPWRIALASAAGRAAVDVARRPRVAILSTGEEIVTAGDAVSEAQIFDSGGPALAALVSVWGGEPVALAPARDEEAAIAAAVADAACDLIVTVGGASVGEHDLVKPALGRLGLKLAVDTVRLRPGKPTWFGVLEDGRRVLGLPGNPASALVCAELFLRPLVMALQGAEASLRIETARLAIPLAATGPREHWMRATLSWGEDGAVATPFADQDSSLVTVFAHADALLRRAAGAPAAEAGSVAEVLRLERG